jgi:UDPglucose--hexose-1-phosphate uridylyltransferase
MGLAVLPSRLKQELQDLAKAILAGTDLTADPVLAKHAHWVDEIKTRVTFTPENALDILLQETGSVFSKVLEDAGVYKCTEEGRAAFRRFIQTVNG